jgi:ABC-2 type transport system permease protein
LAAASFSPPTPWRRHRPCVTGWPSSTKRSCSPIGFTLALALDRELGVLQRLRVSPAPTWMVMTSASSWQVATNLIASVIVVLVGVIVHGLTLNIGQYFLVVAVAALGAVVFLAIGQAIVGLVRSAIAISAFSRLLMILLILLVTVGASGILGDTIKVFADWSPVGALMALFSDALSQSAWSGQDAYSLAACICYIVVFAFIGIRWFWWGSR